MRADFKSPVIKTLRRFKPTKFLATLRDGSTRELGLSTKANKWEQLLTVIEALPWTRIEALNDENVVLGLVDQETDEEEPEDDIGDVGGEVMALTKIMQQVQFTTMQQCAKMFEARDKRDERIAQSMADAMDVMKESYQMAIKMTAMAGAASSGGGEPGEPDKVFQMIQMAMAMKFGTPPPAIAPPKPAPPKPAAANGAGKAITKTS